MTNEEIDKDMKFITEIVSQICDYAVDNGLNPTDTLKTIAGNIIALTQISNFDNWKRRELNG